MITWSIADHKLKKYPHFDAVISSAQAIALATDANAVIKHKFFPFILIENRFSPFRIKKTPPKEKSVKKRPIRYAARSDAYIYSYYRHLLSLAYEAELQKNDLSDNIIAYRRITDPISNRGKSNIDFARDAFLEIKNMIDAV